MLFNIRTFRNGRARKILFYHTSYGLPWWLYMAQILCFRWSGYEVVVYDYSNKVLVNDDPLLLPQVVGDVVTDMVNRRQRYLKNEIEIFHGIGNSLGSYFVYNFALRYPLPRLVLNSGGSVADIVFAHDTEPWLGVQQAYKKLGYGKADIDELWKQHDAPYNAQKIKSEKVFITLSSRDKTIPPSSSEALVHAIQSSGQTVFVERNFLPHGVSVIWNSFRMVKLLKFFSS